MTSKTERELAELRETFPGWEIRESWTTAASGPDRRHLLASRQGITVSAWTASELAREIRRAEASE